MAISIFDLFKIGIGPSSSHTVGPMRAAARFASDLARFENRASVATLRVELYGSLGATGKGHGTDKAILLGLTGEQPDRGDPATIADKLAAMRSARAITIPGVATLPFEEREQLLFYRKALPYHP